MIASRKTSREYSGMSTRLKPSIFAPTAIYRLKNNSASSINSCNVPVRILRSAYLLAPTVSRNRTHATSLCRICSWGWYPKNKRPAFVGLRVPSFVATAHFIPSNTFSVSLKRLAWRVFVERCAKYALTFSVSMSSIVALRVGWCSQSTRPRSFAISNSSDSPREIVWVPRRTQ